MVNENYAVNIIDDIISGTDLLEPSFSRGDREPSWDGFIYAYRDKQKKKNQMYGRAPVQIKSTTKNPKQRDKIAFSVSYADIENYRNDGGAIYYVVYIDNYKNRTVYYSPLLPYVLNELLEKHKGKRKFLLHLKEFPSSARDVENIIINFIENCQRQSSPRRTNWTFNELVEKFNIESPKINYHFTDVYKYKDPLDYLFNHFTEMYVPVDLTGQEYPIGSARLETIQKEMNLPIKVNGRTFYNSYFAGRDKNGYTMAIGNGALSALTTDDKTMFTFKVEGTLSEQIEKGEFLLSVFDSGSVDIGKNTIRIDTNTIANKDKQTIESLRKRHLWNKDLKATLDKAGVKDELSFSNWGEKDAFYASQLIKSILYNEPVKLPDSLEAMSIIKIGNVGVGVFNQRLETGMFLMKSMFNDEMEIVLVIEDGKIPTSHYVVLSCDNFLQLSNTNYNVIRKSVKQFHSPEHYSAVNNLVLQMLLAYDKKKDKELLNAATDISKWLHQEVPDNPCFLINWYQCAYRKGKNDKRIDQKELECLMEEGDIEVRIGAAIVAGKHELAKELILQMPKKKQKDFSLFPIVNLLS